MLVNYKGLKLDKFQIEALQLLEKGYSVIVCAPTGAGKTLIAEYLLEKELKQGNNIIYTAPIKAINNQKFRDFSKIYPEKVGILTGDVTINPQASCLIMTTEIFRNMVLEKDTRLNTVSYV
ncbi:MAG: DEAD/DEAH box helicase, partial [Planctomycetota bacterium]